VRKLPQAYPNQTTSKDAFANFVVPSKLQTSHQTLQIRQGEVKNAWLQAIIASFGSPKASPQGAPLAYLYHLPFPAWFNGHLSHQSINESN
jgi:hypothetical protein